jgi:hypothetical protein
MTKQEILSQMMRTEHPAGDTNLYSLCALLAQQLSAVGGKLDAIEMDGLIEIGASMYQCGRTEFGKDVPVEDLFPSRLSWQLGPEQCRSGYRQSER